LLIVSDMDRIRIHTNWTNTVQKVISLALDDLLDGAHRDLLRACFTDPERLKPSKSRQALTEEAADRFARIALRLRARGHDPQTVAHFVNRLVFCMFAEDVGLLPDKMFERMIRLARPKPETFAAQAAILFAAMRTGGQVGFEAVEWFNGGLFDSDEALPLTWEDMDDLIRANGMDWSDIDPSILGTLFERGLDPDKRSQLGAHYTDRDKIMMILRPVLKSRSWPSGRRSRAGSGLHFPPCRCRRPSACFPPPTAPGAPACGPRPRSCAVASSTDCAPSASSIRPAARATSSTSPCAS
jgi:hypothetical protein